MSTKRARVVTADQWGIPERDERGNVVCRWCRGPVAPPRRTFCGDACVHEWKIRSSPWYVRREVKKRDKGICRLCGLNVIKAHREWRRAQPPAGDRNARKAWRAARPTWEADHIVPVADGGGECGLDNYRLLCRACHVQVTLAWRANRQSNRQSRNPESINRQSAIANQQSGVSSADATPPLSRRRAVRAGAGSPPGTAAGPVPRADVGESVGAAGDPA